MGPVPAWAPAHSYRNPPPRVNRPARGRLASLYRSFTAPGAWSRESSGGHLCDIVHGHNKVLIRPWLAVPALAWVLAGCAAVIPEAARQVAALVGADAPDPPGGQRLIARAEAAIADGAYAEAEAYLDAALSVSPYNAGALRWQAVVYRLTGRAAMADALGRHGGQTIASKVPSLHGGGAPTGMDPAPAAGGHSETDVVERFAVLAELRKAGLVASDDYAARRDANLGALLPLTQPPPVLAPGRPSPRARDVFGRLEAIAGFYALGALDVDVYEAERAAILDGLMPLTRGPGAVAAAPPAPPPDPEAHQAWVERLLATEMISYAEYEAESAALAGQFAPAAGPPAAMDALGADDTPDGAVWMDDAPGAAERPALGPALATRVDVHLALARTPERARRSWEDLQQAHGDTLEGLAPRIARIDLGAGKGVFFQLSAGPLADMAAAEALCGKLMRRSLYCAPLVF